MAIRVNRTLLLRSMGCAGITLGFVPLLGVCTALFGHPASANIPRIAWLLCSGLAGFHFYGILRSRTSFSAFLRAAALTVTAFLCGAAALLPFFSSSLWEALALGAIFAAAHIWAAHYSGRDFSEVLNSGTYWKMLALYAVFLLFPVIAGNWLTLSYSHLLNAACFLVVTAFYSVIHNQANIDDLTASRHYSLEYLPKKIRTYNVILVVGILVIIAGLFTAICVFSNDAENLLHQLWEWIRSLFSGREYTPEEAPPPVQDLAGMAGALPEMGEQSDSLEWLGRLIQFLFSCLLIGGLLAVILYNRHAILAAFRRWWRQLKELLGRFFRRVPLSSGGREENADYTDYNQSITADGAVEKDFGSRGKLRQWRKDYRRYQRMGDSPEKYRTGYGLAVSGLSLCGAGIRESDTPLETAEKAARLFEGTDYRHATDTYNLLRYGERPYSAGPAETLDRVLSEVNGLQGRDRRKGKPDSSGG